MRDTIKYRLVGNRIHIVDSISGEILFVFPNGPGASTLLYDVWSRGENGIYCFAWDSESASADGTIFRDWSDANAHDYYTNRGFKGCVLETGEMNFHDDSDFYAVVWDESAGCVHRVSDGTTRYAAPSLMRADATPEAIAKAQAWMVNVWAPPQVRRSLEEKRAKVAMGDRVRVNRGRKVAKGTEGRVFFMQECRFAFRVTETKIGIALTERKEGGRLLDVAWTYVKNVDKLNVLPVTDAEVSDYSQSWKNAFRSVGSDPRCPVR